MKITLEPTGDQTQRIDPHCVVSIAHPHDHADMQTVLSDLVRPALIAWGFHPHTVDKHISVSGWEAEDEY